MRQAALIAVPQERAPVLQAARTTFEKLMQQFPKDIQAAQAKMERAKCLALAGDRGGAMNELRQFLQDPLQNTPAAPYAVLHLATLLANRTRPRRPPK